MIPRISAGALAASAFIALSGSLHAVPAAACNRMDGCIHDAQLENYGMMHDGRMDTAMRNGAANVEAFKEMQAAAQRPVSQPTQPGPRGRHR